MGEADTGARRAKVAGRARTGAGPHVALVAVQLIFGTWPIFGKLALRVLPSTGLVALRVAGAAAIFYTLHSLSGRVRLERKSDYGRFLLYGILGVVLNQFLFVKGLALSTVVNATILGTAIPVFALLVSALLGRERLTTRKALGTAVAAAGVVILVDPTRADLSGGRTLGNVLLVANTVAYGAFIAVTQDTFRRYGALTSITWVFIFGAAFTVPVGGYQLARTPLGDVGWLVWLVVLYIVLVPTVGAYYLNAWALERVAPSTVATYIYLQPLVAFALAPLALGTEEFWNLRALAAAAFIFAGVALVTLRSGSAVAEDLSEHPDAIGH